VFVRSDATHRPQTMRLPFKKNAWTFLVAWTSWSAVRVLPVKRARIGFRTCTSSRRSGSTRRLLSNAEGVWLGCTYSAKQMLARKPVKRLSRGGCRKTGGENRGWVINMCSVLGLLGMSGTSCYSGSKTGAVFVDGEIFRTRSACLFSKSRLLQTLICDGRPQLSP
jgi:hypothetical protein